MTLRLLVPAAGLLLSLGCHPARPVLDAGSKPDVGGSISGTVTANDGVIPLGARKVTAVNTETGVKFDVSTTTTGGYTMRVPRGTYRLEVELRGGEKLATQPDPTEVGAGDLDAGRDFVVALR
jgi:hypothetical protein